MTKEIKPSDTVMLISGGPVMTVTSILSEDKLGLSAATKAKGDIVDCQWFDKLDNLHQDSFFASNLIHVSGMN